MLSVARVNEFYEACEAVIKAGEKRPGTAVSWAVGYARAGMKLHTTEAIKTQCLYILGNIAGWRGPEARQAREIFRQLSK